MKLFKRLGGWFKRASKKVQIDPETGAIGVKLGGTVQKGAAYYEIKSRFIVGAGRGQGIAFSAEEVKHYADLLP